MPRKSVKIENKIDTTDEKRNLIDSLELLRGNAQLKNDSITKKSNTKKDNNNLTEDIKELHELRQNVRKLQSENILLESDLKNMEQKALDAIAESGKLHHQLDLARDNSSANHTRYYEEERQALLNELHHSRYTHEMLTEAIYESQNEITRLTQTIEKLTFKLLAA